MGLIIHRFHIRKRKDGEEKTRKGKGRADEYAAWCVHCDVCGDYSSLVSPAHPSLYYFQNRHLEQQIHLANGQRILSSMTAVEEVIRFDDAAATAAAASRFATSMQEVSSPLPAEAAQRDATPIQPLFLQETRLEKLVTENPALQWVEEEDDYGNTPSRGAPCVFGVYTHQNVAQTRRRFFRNL